MCPPTALRRRRSRRSTTATDRHRRPRDTEVAEPIEITVTGPGEGAIAYGHLQIRVEELARATVVVDLRGSGTYADNVEIIVGDAAVSA